MPQTIFCANGCAGDKVEIPITAVRKSLPKKRKNAGVLTKQKKRTGKSALMVGKEAGSCLIFGGKGLFKKQKICKKSTEHYTVQAYF